MSIEVVLYMKKYIAPSLDVVKIDLKQDILTGSVENFSSYIDGPGNWGDDPIIDPDDEIDW